MGWGHLPTPTIDHLIITGSNRCVVPSILSYNADMLVSTYLRCLTGLKMGIKARVFSLPTLSLPTAGT